MTNISEKFFIGIDVGTGSARAGLFDRAGHLLSSAKRDIEIYRGSDGHVEQSSENIWRCVCEAVRQVVSDSAVDVSNIMGVGFDATCSLVVLDEDDNPLTVSFSGEEDRNIIVWMDHRATEQAERINATRHRVLDYVGGKISPEMETPKLLWLKENLPDTYYNASGFFDLTDYLTFRATGDLARSVCTVTCKWTYLAHERRWDKSYFDQIGLGDIASESFVRIGCNVVDPGAALGSGLTDKAASDLGLRSGTAVAAGLIDAHAGGVGTIGAAGPFEGPENRMAYVFGTSACTMSSSNQQAFVPGVWGPYYSSMVPGLWLSEGGQSAAGEAIAHLVRCHPAYPEAKAAADAAGKNVLAHLLDILSSRIEKPKDASSASGNVIVVPEFLGNRAPFADPEAKAVISGLNLDTSIGSLVELYVAGLAGLGYGLRQILEVQKENGVSPGLVVISGGAGDHPVIKQIIADSAGISVAEAGTPEPVLLGSAMLAAVASREFPDLRAAMTAMSSLGQIYEPGESKIGAYHEKRFAAFTALQASAKLVRGAV